MPSGSIRHMGVTPQIMSRAVVDPMLTHLETLGRPKEAWDAYLLRLFVDKLYDPDPAERAVVAWTVCSAVSSLQSFSCTLVAQNLLYLIEDGVLNTSWVRSRCCCIPALL